MPEKPPQREIVIPGEARRVGTAPSTGRRRTTSRAPSVLAGAVAVFGRAVGWLVERGLSHPVETAGTIAAVGAAGYIAVNALGLQEGRHPAPILPQPKQVAAREQRQDASIPARTEPVQRAKADATGPSPRQPVSNGNSEASAALAQLVEETTASVTPKADKAVLQAQQALTKLGYGPLKDDGLTGPDTRSAIEKFERDHKLAVTGVATGRTLKELAAHAARKR